MIFRHTRHVLKYLYLFGKFLLFQIKEFVKNPLIKADQAITIRLKLMFSGSLFAFTMVYIAHTAYKQRFKTSFPAATRPVGEITSSETTRRVG